jgi:hypothetical protein
LESLTTRKTGCPPAGVIQFADAIQSSIRDIGLELRIGIHSSECDIRGEELEAKLIKTGGRQLRVMEGVHS